MVPTRDEIAAVFSVLRTEARIGNTSIGERTLLERVGRSFDCGCIKLRLILRILGEMWVCSVQGPTDGVYVFEINFAAPKTSIEVSHLLQNLRRQEADGTL